MKKKMTACTWMIKEENRIKVKNEHRRIEERNKKN